MATLLHRLGRWSATHAWRVVAGWLVVLVGLGVLAGSFSTPMTQVVRFPGSEFSAVMEELQDRLPEVDGNIGTAVLVTEDDEPFTAEQERAIADVFAEWESEGPFVTSVVDPFAAQSQASGQRDQLAAGERRLEESAQQLADGEAQLEQARGQLALGQQALAQAEAAAPEAAATEQLRAQVTAGEEQVAQGEAQLEQGREQLEAGRAQLEDGRTLAESAADIRFVSEGGNAAITQIGFELDPQSIAPADRERIVEIAEPLSDVGVEAYFGAEITQETSVVGPGEIIGLATAALVLLIMLGSIIAAGLPLLVSLIGVAVGIVGAVAATYFFEMHAMTPALALMLGLAVGIDYTLFILNRHRTQMLAGMDATDSIALATGTAGNAVVFAGSTVVVALAALVVSGIPVLAQMGLVAAATVVAAVLMSITLGPALIGLAGHRVLGRRARARIGHADHTSRPAFGSRYAALVTRRPWLTVLAVLGIVALAALPARDLRLGLPDGSSEDPGSSARIAYSTIADEFGPGMNGPLVVVAERPEGADADETLALQASLASDLGAFEGVRNVLPIGVSEDDRTLAYQVVLDSGPTEARTDQVVTWMLEDMPRVEEANDVSIGMTGRTVANLEISDKLSGALPGYLAIVVGLSLIILMMVFRSVVVPLIATGGFLLTIAASFGALVAVYQWGWLGSIFNVTEPGPLLSFGPILLIGVLFGLAMDYQMFLVSGMREAHAHGEDARSAVRSGYVHGAKVVTAAAAIMFAVFGGFVWSHMVMVRPIGFGLAIGVLVDAFLIRMTLTPALMHLLGERAWYLPRWLDRLLPDLDVEGTTLAERLETEAPRTREAVDA
ncbi:MMPL family transporter [Alteromonas gracilis]